MTGSALALIASLATAMTVVAEAHARRARAALVPVRARVSDRRADR